MKMDELREAFAIAAVFDEGGAPPAAETRNLGLLLDVEVPVSVEVGGTRMSLREVLDLASGSVVRLDKRADEPVDLRVNGKLIARGEVVMIDDCYGFRITKIVDPDQRVRSAVR
jgi:flagellar motor switch protein FliN/FliY